MLTIRLNSVAVCYANGSMKVCYSDSSLVKQCVCDIVGSVKLNRLGSDYHILRFGENQCPIVTLTVRSNSVSDLS